MQRNDDEYEAPGLDFPLTPPPPFSDEDLEELRGRLRQVPVLLREAVNEYRENYGWSQARLARELASIGLPLDATAITRIEKGTRSVRAEEAWALCAVFRMEINALFAERTMVMSTQQRLEVAQRNVARLEDQMRNVQGSLEWEQAHLRRLRELCEAEQDAMDDLGTLEQELSETAEPADRANQPEATAPRERGKRS